MNTNCLFCKIIGGEIPAEKIYEDEQTLAFLDITPVNKGHTLVVPKKHSRNLFDADDGTLASLLPAAKKIAHALQKSIGAEGVNIHINNEPSAGQVIFHTHIHIIPRFRDDGIIMWRGYSYPNDEMKEMAERIQQAL